MEKLISANDYVDAIAHEHMEVIAIYGTDGLRKKIEAIQTNAIKACAEIVDEMRYGEETDLRCARDRILGLLPEGE